MKRQFLIRSLTKLKEFHKQLAELENTGIDLHEFTDSVTGIAEEAVVMMAFDLQPDDETDYYFETLSIWLYDPYAEPAEDFLNAWIAGKP